MNPVRWMIFSSVYLVHRFWYYEPAGFQCVIYGGGNYNFNNMKGFLGTSLDGTQVNVFPPQHLSYANYPAVYDGSGNQIGGNAQPFCFSEAPYDPTIMPNAAHLNGLRAANPSKIKAQWNLA